MAEQGVAPPAGNEAALRANNALNSQQQGGGGQTNVACMAGLIFGIDMSSPDSGGLNSLTVNSALNMFGDLGSASLARDANWGLASNSIIGDIIAKLMEGKDVSPEEMAGVAAEMGGSFEGVSAPSQDLVGQGILPPTGVADDYHQGQKLANER